MKKERESEKVKDARFQRAQRLGIAVQHWQRLAEAGSYPQSLHDILLKALKREYALGLRKGSR